MSVITYAQAVERIEAIVSTNPDFVYEPVRDSVVGTTCVYFAEDNTPSCLVGHAFAEELNALDVLERHNEEGIGSLVAIGVLKATSRAANFLDTVQTYQDAQSTWGVSLQQALADDDDTLDDALAVA